MEKLKIEYLPQNKKYIKPFFLKKNPYPIIAKTNCPFLWSQLIINVHGDVTPCCFTYKKEHAFGNINENTIEEIWNNEKYVSSRRFFLNKDYKDCKTICAGCNNFKRMGKRNLLLKNIDFIKYFSNKVITKIKL